MALFVVRHKHTEETCRARDPEMEGMILEHLSQKNAESYGLNIQSKAVIDGKQTLCLTLDADSKQQVQEFMTPFAEAGSVEVMPASSCEVVVERGAC